MREAMRGYTRPTFHRFTARDLDLFWGVWVLFVFFCLVVGSVFVAFHDFEINLVVLRSRTTV